MTKTAKMCFDKVLPQELHRPHRAINMGGGRARAISPRNKQWLNGSTLRIRFLDGTAEQQKMVERVAPQWTEHANLNFVFGNDPQAEIRISFDRDDGAWSYVGTDNASIPQHQATMNLGWLDEGVILHEFGHMIGLGHEHQNPDGGIDWNEQVVIDALAGAPNFWDEATVRHNVLRKYSVDQIHGTKFDPSSVMLYEFPAGWTNNSSGTEANENISAQDKAFVASAEMYPGRGAPKPAVPELPVCEAIAAEISEPGEEDLFSFTANSAREYIIETTGSTDVVMSLFGPDSPTRLVATDDDSGQGTNSRITAALQPGKYFVRVVHYSQNRTGEYRVRVSAF